MNRMRDIEDFPIGCRVVTPTGRIGLVVKHHTTSKFDCFARVVVQYSRNPRDGVVLQPQYLTLIAKNPKPTPHTLTMEQLELEL